MVDMVWREWGGWFGCGWFFFNVRSAKKCCWLGEDTNNDHASHRIGARTSHLKIFPTWMVDHEQSHLV